MAEMWERALRDLRERLSPENYETWLAPVRCLGLDSGVVTLRIPNRFFADWLSAHYLELILEAVAEIAPHVRRSEQVVEHVRMRMAQQICGDLTEGGSLRVLRLGNRWDLAFHQAVKRDAASAAIRQRLEQGKPFAIVTAPDARPWVRMVIERLFPTLPVLSHVEIPRGVDIESLGTVG